VGEGSNEGKTLGLGRDGTHLAARVGDRFLYRFAERLLTMATLNSKPTTYNNNAKIELTRESAILEARLIPITAEMNHYPLRVNKSTWERHLKAAQENADFLREFCCYLADDDYFRPNSTADCAKAVFANRGIEPKKLSKVTKKPLTDKDTLAELASNGDNLAGAIIDARSAISRFGQLKAWKGFAEQGFVQTSWDPLGTPHGRYASASPSLTNRIDPIRDTIEADEGYSFLSIDNSQSEYVVWASLSGDLTLSEAFLAGKDFHTETARLIKATVPSWEPREEDERQGGKTINFALLYLMQVQTLARKLACSVEVANKIVKVYQARAEIATSYIQQVLALAKQTGYVETYFGRRRYCEEYQQLNGSREVHEVQKTLWNHVCAGSSAELVKQKQLKTWVTLRQSGLTAQDVRVAINEFDEILLHVRDSVLEEVTSLATKIWETPEKGFLPFRVGVKSAKTWGGCAK
jgi:DNA polymerase-1